MFEHGAQTREQLLHKLELMEDTGVLYCYINFNVFLYMTIILVIYNGPLDWFLILQPYTGVL